MRGGNRMLILKTDAVLTKEQKEALRKEVKAHTGEDCIVLDRGVQVSEIRLKKEQPLWWRLLRRA